ncbi:MAG: transposase [Pirellulaceae bacterium]
MRAIVELIKTYNVNVQRYDALIKELVRQHADYEIVASLPGSAELSHARLIAALGDDRTQYENATSLQNASGISPITTQSGTTRIVSSRWACSKFMKQTFHEYAGLSIEKSKWAKAYYDAQRAKGKSAQMAKRSLAYKWQRIIFRCWQDRQPYDEARYIASLRQANSPLITLIDQAD